MPDFHLVLRFVVSLLPMIVIASILGIPIRMALKYSNKRIDARINGDRHD
jgi:hypothetical protein